MHRRQTVLEIACKPWAIIFPTAAFLVPTYGYTNQDAATARQDLRLSEFQRLPWQSEGGCHHREDILVVGDVAGLLDREAS